MSEGYELPLVRREEIADGTMAFWFDIDGTDFAYTAGQYADFTLIDPPETDAEGMTRSFSIASAPGELLHGTNADGLPVQRRAIMIATRMRNTAFKNVLKNLPIGETVAVSRSMGSFTLHQNVGKPALFVAGGIGVTPIRSIIADAITRHLPHRMYLFSMNSTPERSAFLSDFAHWASIDPNFHFIPVATAMAGPDWPYRKGKITAEVLRESVPDIDSAIAYIVGPPGMVASFLPIAEAAGIDPDNIRTEEFAGY